jgi:hypothetical protein
MSAVISGSITDEDFAYLNEYAQKNKDAEDALDQAMANLDDARTALSQANDNLAKARQNYSDALVNQAFAQVAFEDAVKDETQRVAKVLFSRLDPNGGTLKGTPTVTRIGRGLYSIDSLPIPTYAGHDFLGWNLDDGTLVGNPDGSTSFVFRLTPDEADGDVLFAMALRANFRMVPSDSVDEIGSKDTLIAGWKEKATDDDGDDDGPTEDAPELDDDDDDDDTGDDTGEDTGEDTGDDTGESHDGGSHKIADSGDADQPIKRAATHGREALVQTGDTTSFGLIGMLGSLSVVSLLTGLFLRRKGSEE